MVDEGKVAEVLAEFARTLATDYSTQGILDRFVGRVVDALPVSAAGITLISAVDLLEGPCLAAFASGELVVVGDLGRDEAFPRFAQAAASAGLGAVFALPLHYGDTRIGALDLYRDSPGELNGHDLEVAQTLADVAASYLLNAEGRQACHHVVDLREPLDPGAPTNEEHDPRSASQRLLARSVAQQRAVAEVGQRAVEADDLWSVAALARDKAAELFGPAVAGELLSKDDDFLGSLAHLVRAAGQRHTATTQLACLVDHDALTGLANRSLFLDRVEQARAACRLSAVSFAVVFFDLDGFKHVNGGLGHDAGDEALRGLAYRLRDVVGPGDTVARLDGDEFAVLCPDVADEAAATAVAERIRDALADEIPTTQGAVTLTASMGIALGDAASDGAGLLRDVDTAMYAAKAAGRNRVEVFDAGMQARARHRFRMAATLQTALDDDGVEVHYQPTIELATGRVVGVEALARLRGNDGALIPPNEFIPVAEQAGLIAALGETVLRQACCDARPWIAADPAFMLSVNVSAHQLTRPEVAGTIERILAETGLGPASLWLEITESALLSGADAIAAISRLRQSGIRFATDDFGTGYSSLAHLRQVPVDMLKIDRSFVSGLHADIQDRALVEASVSLARTFRLPSTAEGVETTEQLAELNQLGCDYAQGHLWSRAVEAHTISALLSVPPTRSPVAAPAGSQRPEPANVTACPTPPPNGSP